MPSTVLIKEDIAVRSGTIMADPTVIRQIVVNLCTNAFHAMENEKGVLTISLLPKTLSADEVQLESGKAPGDFIELMVRDTGIVMDKETMASIFGPYFTTKDTGKGTGLGLALVYGIVKNLNGLIRMESEPGKGTSFRVYIPAILEKHGEGASRQSNYLPTGTERILFVDDEPTIVRLQKEFSGSLGYTVTCRGDSEDALAFFKEDPGMFDLLITDQTMARLSGADFSREVLKLRADMPIILCTGYSSVFSEQQAMKMGIRKYLLKPGGRLPCRIGNRRERLIEKEMARSSLCRVRYCQQGLAIPDFWLKKINNIYKFPAIADQVFWLTPGVRRPGSPGQTG